MKIKGKVALVTGAAKRIGRVIALQLAQAGAHVVIHYHHSEKEAHSLGRTLEKEFGTQAQLVQGDLKKFSSLKEIADEGWKAFGKIDILVNNASTFYPTPLGEVKEEQWDELFSVNAKAPFFLSEMIGLKMKKRKKGKIILIADWAGQRPYSGYIPYCASKAALLSINQGLAKTLAPEVQVNAILPGPILWPENMAEKAKSAVLAKTPLAKVGSPKDVASTVRFLIEGNDFMTGSELHVDGGRHL